MKCEPTFLPSVCSEGCLWHTAACWWESPAQKEKRAWGPETGGGTGGCFRARLNVSSICDCWEATAWFTSNWNIIYSLNFASPIICVCEKGFCSVYIITTEESWPTITNKLFKLKKTYFGKVDLKKNQSSLSSNMEEASTHPAQLVLSDGTGVHEGLGDDREHCVHVVWRLDVKDKLRVLHNVDPETQRQTEDTEETLDLLFQLSFNIKSSVWSLCKTDLMTKPLWTRSHHSTWPHSCSP